MKPARRGSVGTGFVGAMKKRGPPGKRFTAVSYTAALTFTLTNAGPLVPKERSLLVLVGGAYIIGDFIFAALFGYGGTRLASIRRRRIGVVIAITSLVFWIVGRIPTPDQYPWLGAERALLDVGGWFAMGPAALAALLWLLVGRRVASSKDQEREDDGVETTGQSFGLVLAGAYIMIWSGIQAVPADGHVALAAISGAAR